MPHVLFSAYQQLKETIPYLALGTFPTPVERLSCLEGSLQTGNLFSKRDDKSSDEYGGNKVRKLEFILAEAVAQKKNHTITFGYAGSGLKTLRTLFCGAARRLERLLPSFPTVELAEGDFEVCKGYLGDGYAHFTEEGMDAVKRLEESDGIKPDGTYSGKTMAALIGDAAEGKLENKVTLFWNTYNSVDFGDKIRGVDFQRLPRAYHAYFTDRDQPLEIHTRKTAGSP